MDGMKSCWLICLEAEKSREKSPLPFKQKRHEEFFSQWSPEQTTQRHFWVFSADATCLSWRAVGICVMNFQETLGPTFSTEKPQKPRSWKKPLGLWMKMATKTEKLRCDLSHRTGKRCHRAMNQRPRFMGPERRSFTLFSRAEWEGENTNRSLPIKWSNARELWNLHFFACTCKGNHIVKAGILLGTLLEIKTTSEWVIPIATDTVDKILFGWRLRCQKNVLVWLNWGLSHTNLQKKNTWQNLKNESHVYVSKFQGRFKWISY